MHGKNITLSPVLEQLLLHYAGLSSPVNAQSRAVKLLSAQVKTISDEYLAGDSSFKGDLFRSRALRRAYSCYYLPVNLVKLLPVLDELFTHPDIKGFTEPHVSILDLGCGPGTFLLGVLEYLAAHQNLLSPDIQKIDLWGIDQVDENVTTAKKIISRYLAVQKFPSSSTWQLHFRAGSIMTAGFPHPLIPQGTQYDLIIAGNVFTEIDQESFSVLAPILEKLLSPHGTLILIDPGTRASSRRLIQLRDMLLEHTALTLYAPCLERGLCPSLDNPRDWCHQKLSWSPPAIVHVIDRHIGFTKEKGIPYSYFTFRNDGKALIHPTCDFPREKVWRVVSYQIRHKGEERLFVCNGKERKLLRRLTKNISDSNQDFSDALRGDSVAMDGMVRKEAFLDITRDSIFRILKR
ncbi:MAG: methyltransferase domain-containing protein [Proteobacteria bacterium]|nr:methyltransferase domain-containing protein [Pseudomonadota bacterium]